MSPYFQDGLHSLKDLKEVVSIRGYGMMGVLNENERKAWKIWISDIQTLL